MHTGGPGDDGRHPPRDEAPHQPTSVDPPPLAPNPGPEPVIGGARQRSTGAKVGLGILVILVGIPLGLLVFGALLFGACLLGNR
jgi:hypothetical protein